MLANLPERYPNLVTAAQIDELTAVIRGQLRDYGQMVVSTSVSTITTLLVLLVYLVVVPVLVFFFLIDKERIKTWFSAYLPEQRTLATRVWIEMDLQIGRYVRGKVVEIVIVAGVSAVTFATMGLEYALLLGVLVGISVLIPYIGAAVVTLPVAMVGFFQWGWGEQFAYLMVAYAIIQALDGNVLVPLLFSEAVNLHPVAIVVAVLIFGGIWGVWGVFFAIPLATLIKTLLVVWPGVRNSAMTDSVQTSPSPS